MPDVARVQMGAPFKSLLKIAEAESAGRMDTRWKLEDVRYDMRIFRKAATGEDGSSMYAFRAMTTIEAPPHVLDQVIMSFAQHARRWIPGMRELRVLKQIDDNTDVVYLGRARRRASDFWSHRRSPAQLAATIVAVFLMLGGLMLAVGGQLTEGMARVMLGCVFFVVSSDRLAVWPRDLVVMRHRHRLSDKTIVIGLRSVVDETCPPRSPWLLVRGNITGGGFIIQGLSNGKSLLSFVSQAHFGGWSGVYGAYGMHVEQMALLISLKNYIHSELTPVASQVPLLVPASVTSGFEAVRGGSSHHSNNTNTNSNNNAITNDTQRQNSISPATGFFMADVARPTLTQVVSQTPEPFRGTMPQSSSPLPAESRRKVARVSATVLSDFGDSAASEDEVPAPPAAGVLLSNFPVRVSFELPRPPLYTEQALQNREMALRVSGEGVAEGWVPLAANKGVAVWQKKMGEGRPTMVRGAVSEVGCCAGYLMGLLGQTERKAQYDSMFMRGNLVEVVDDFTSVCYERYHPIFPTSGRDFVVLYSVAKRPDGSYLRSAVSVEHGDCPEVSGVVRGAVLFASMLVTPSPADPHQKCDVTYTVQVDLRGSIPAWIVARVASEQPQVLAALRDLIARSDEPEDALRTDPLAARFERVKVVKGPPQTSAPIPLGGGSPEGGAQGGGGGAAGGAAPPDAANNNGNATNGNNNNNNNNNNEPDTSAPGAVGASNATAATSSFPDMDHLSRRASMGGHTPGSPAVPVPFSPDRSLDDAAADVLPGESDGLQLAALAGGPGRALSPAEAHAMAHTVKRLLSAASDKSSAWVARGTQDDVVLFSRAPEPGSSLRSFKVHPVVRVFFFFLTLLPGLWGGECAGGPHLPRGARSGRAGPLGPAVPLRRGGGELRRRGHRPALRCLSDAAVCAARRPQSGLSAEHQSVAGRHLHRGRRVARAQGPARLQGHGARTARAVGLGHSALSRQAR